MNLRTLFALLAAGAAISICAAPASATFVTAPEGLSYTDTIAAESEGSTTLHSVVGVACEKSTLEGKVESHGAEVTAKGNLSSLTFTECGSNDVTVKKAGSLEFHALEGGDGTVTSSGAEISVQVTSLGITCVFTTNKTHLGTLTSSESSEGKATLDTESASIPRTGGSFFCGSSAEMTGSYTFTTPSGLTLDASAPDFEGHFVTTGTKITLLSGTEAGTHKLEWTIDGFDGGIVCDESKWDGELADETEDSMRLDLTFFKECHTTDSSDKFKIEMNGCSFRFFVAKNTGDATEQTAFFRCNKPAEILHPKCTAKVPTQVLQGITYTKINLNNKHALTLDFKVRLKGVETEGACGAAKKEGWLEGSLTVEAVDAVTKAAAHLTAT